MTGARRLGRRAGPLLMACVLTVVACDSPRVGEVPRTSDGELDVEALMDFVEEERGRTFDGDIVVEYVPRDEVPGVPIAEREWILLELLGIADDAARAEFEELAASGKRITAACCPIIVAEGFDERATAIVIVHELSHLLDRSDWMTVADVGIETRAHRTAVAEGVAVLVEEAYADQIGVPPPRDAPRPRIEAADRLIRLLEFPYVGGRELASRVLAEGDAWAIEDALDDPPRSSAEVLFPERYLDGVEPVAVDPPARPVEGITLREGTLGAFVLALVVEPVLGEDRSRDLVEGWVGDSYVLVRAVDETCLAARIVTSHPEDATALADALTAVLGGAATRPDGSVVELLRCAPQ